MVCDVASPASVDSMVQTVVKQFGGVDILGQQCRMDRSQDALRYHRRRVGSGHERLSAQRMVLHPRRGQSDDRAEAQRQDHQHRFDLRSLGPQRSDGLYHGKSRACSNLTRSIAVQLAPEGIRVNSISPNRIGSPVGQQDVPENRFVKNLAGRRGVPMDIAKAAVFLACDESDFIYAVDLPVDGGALAIRD